MATLRLTRYDTASHSGNIRSRSLPPTRHNNACVPVANGRLSRRDVFYSPAVERSSSRDRRHIVPSTTLPLADTAKGRLSRRDVFYRPAIERSKSTDRRYVRSMYNDNCSTGEYIDVFL